MTTPDSPLIKEESDNPPQLGRSKLGKELGRSRFSHAKAEHPSAVTCSIGLIVLMIVFIRAASHEIGKGVQGSLLPVFYIFLILACFGAWLVCVVTIFDSISIDLISETDDALFFLKLIATGYSWEEVGRIMNSYFYQRRLWPTNSYFYDSKQCYNFFVSYSKECSDPVIEPFIEQAKRKLTEIMAQRWDRIELPDKL